MKRAAVAREDEYECEWHDCDRKSNDFDNFKNHVLLHCDEDMEKLTSVKCSWGRCGVTFECEKPFLKYLRHLLIHCHIVRLMIKGDSDRQKKKLPVCQLPYFPSKELLLHSLAEPRRCKWNECPYVTDDIDDYYVHVKQHFKRTGNERGEPWICMWEDCKDAKANKVFRNSANLGIHVRGHTEEKQFACSRCGRQFACVENFRDHLSKQIEADDVTQMRYKCKHCGEAFARRPQLTAHTRSEHKVKVECSHCVRTFNSKHHLEEHLRSLSNSEKSEEKSHTCPYCLSTSFATRRALLSHVRERHQTSVFQCDICSFESPVYAILWDHVYTHHERRIYSCHVCGFRVFFRRRIDKHLREEHGLTPGPGYKRFQYEMKSENIFQIKHQAESGQSGNSISGFDENNLNSNKEFEEESSNEDSSENISVRDSNEGISAWRL